MASSGGAQLGGYVLKNCDSDAELASFLILVASYFTFIRNGPCFLLCIYYKLSLQVSSDGCLVNIGHILPAFLLSEL